MAAQHPDEADVYSARDEYLSKAVVQNYIRDRFSGPLGRYRFHREQRAVNDVIAQVPCGEVEAILDCPTGTGRWLANLASLGPKLVTAVDVSPAMLGQAKTVSLGSITTKFQEGVAENLPFEDNSFDLVFCHALLKHLPESVQSKVIRELARVTSKYVIVAASVRRGPAGVIRRFRHSRGAVAVSRQWFEESVAGSGLIIITSRKATTPLGVEFSYLLRKCSNDS